jgi:hypothetical protein
MEFYIFSRYTVDWRSEALHQLCSALNDCGERAYMWYTDSKMENRHDHRRLYGNLYNTRITGKYKVDHIDNDRAVWVLSDNHKLDFYEFKSKAKRMIWFMDIPKVMNRSIIPDHPDIRDCVLLAQTHIGERVINAYNTGQPVLRLTDYVAEDLIASEEEIADSQRIRQVVYNDQGGERFIVPIKAAMPDIRFLGISQFPRDMQRDLGMKSSIYLDLGRHCHLHRNLRVMALLGASLVTGAKSTVLSPVDLPINTEWLFDVSRIKEHPYEHGEQLRSIVLDHFDNPNRVLNEGLALRTHLRSGKQDFYTSLQTVLDYLK